jgi:proteasome assembly chaperone (PAC2) family protein
MSEPGIQIDKLPDLKNPLLIAGFDGWGNALKISSGMAAYLVRKFSAQRFAEINPDLFFRYDETRPVVHIEEGVLKSLTPPGGTFYAAQTASDGRDLVILKSDEPQLRWSGFVQELFNLCSRLNIHSIITMGSMYDQVLHTDRIVSATASDATMISMLRQKGVNSISYQGPGAIHSSIGILAHLGKLLASLGGFELNTEDLEANWEKLNIQIENLIENNAELQAVVKELRKAKTRGSGTALKGAVKDEKIINIKDFLQPK